MKKNKKFDCVQMKWNIQQQIARENAGLSEEELKIREKEEIRKAPILSSFVEKVRPTKITDLTNQKNRA